MFSLSGIIITCFLCVLLFSKKNKSQADIILGFWLLVTGIHLALYYLFISGRYIQFPYLLGIEIPLPLAHGPFLFLYAAALTNHKLKTSTRFIQFLPIGIIYLFMTSFFRIDADEKILVYRNAGKGYEYITGPVLVLIMISGVVYVILSLLLLRKHKKNISHQFSYSEKINLNWLRFLIFGTAIIWICVLVSNDFLIYTFAVIYVILIGYFGIRQVGIFTPMNLYHQPNHPIFIEPEKNSLLKKFITNDDASEVEKNKYQKSGLSSEAAARIHKALLLLMHEEKVFTNPELTLAELAEKLHTHPNNLSQVINSFEKKNFYDYINFLRIEEFMQLTQKAQNKNFTLLSLAFECGFNSKTSFNRNFKKVTGLAPSEYLKQTGVVQD